MAKVAPLKRKAGAQKSARFLVPPTLKTLAPGTASRAKGRQRVESILSAAYELLGSSDLSSFSMRNVAAEAGVDLKNVQYYFPTKQDLVLALLECLGYQHEEATATADSSSDDPEVVLRVHMEAWVRENMTPGMRSFSINSWVMFGSSFSYSGEGLSRYYERFLARVRRHVKQVVPDVSDSELTTRVHLIAALLEGAVITFNNLSTKEKKTACAKLVNEAMRIAKGD